MVSGTGSDLLNEYAASYDSAKKTASVFNEGLTAFLRQTGAPFETDKDEYGLTILFCDIPVGVRLEFAKSSYGTILIDGEETGMSVLAGSHQDRDILIKPDHTHFEFQPLYSNNIVPTLEKMVKEDDS